MKTAKNTIKRSSNTDFIVSNSPQHKSLTNHPISCINHWCHASQSRDCSNQVTYLIRSMP